MAESAIEPSIRKPGDVITVIIAENDNARGIIQFDVERVSATAILYMHFNLYTFQFKVIYHLTG